MPEVVDTNQDTEDAGLEIKATLLPESGGIQCLVAAGSEAPGWATSKALAAITAKPFAQPTAVIGFGLVSLAGLAAFRQRGRLGTEVTRTDFTPTADV